MTVTSGRMSVAYEFPSVGQDSCVPDITAWEAEAGGSQIQGQIGLHIKTISKGGSGVGEKAGRWNEGQSTLG